ncbi:MAG: SusC/RagA family TonB-linked outer membrane protein [Dysgonamonadaceae bacterium]|jgi:TonB-linked SusC/RagA family outer membrane protein|nr:SusC/RagA family TonB-linked outer membrane protein [Dysgonamonadaceae bacterium]
MSKFGLVCAVLLLLLTPFSYAKGQPLSPKITVQLNNATLLDALRKINEQCGSLVMFKNEEVRKETKRITLSLDKANVEEAVAACLDGTRLQYSKRGNEFIITPRPEQNNSSGKPEQELGKVSGRVLDDATGEPLASVSVIVKGTTKGVWTDANGFFEIENLTDNYVTLQVLYLGKINQEVRIKLNTSTVFRLKDDDAVMGEVVVTGYQVISRERSAGAFDIIHGSTIKESAQSRGSILESLEGLSSGFSVNLSNDAVSKYLVRGITSINSSKEPLFVLDGVPLSAEDMESMLSASDIESVSILKDATAVSIWGSRASNGVVVIVTRKGSNTHGNVKVGYTGNVTLKGKVDLDYFNLMDSRTFIKNATERFESDDFQASYPYDIMMTDKNKFSSPYYQALYPHETILYDWKNGKISIDERNTRLEKLALQNGFQSYSKELMSSPWLQNHTVSLSGGDDKINVIGSLGYEGQTGDYHNTDNTYKLNFKQNFKVAKWLDWDVIINASHTDSREYINPLETYGTAAFNNFIPYSMLRNADGSSANFKGYNFNEEYWDADQYTFGISQDFFPVTDFYDSTIKTGTTKIRANTGIELDLWKGIGYEARFSYQRNSSNAETYIPQDTWYIRSARLDAIDGEGNQYLPATGGDFTVNNSFNTDWTVRNQLTFNRDFNDLKHQITALAGTEWRESKTKGYSSFQRGYDYQTMFAADYDLTAAKNFGSSNYWGNAIYIDYDDISQSEIVLRYVSYYANMAYTFAKKYTINGNVRIDQSNLFGTDVNNQYKPIGSLGLAWAVSKEKFLQNFEALNTLSIRLGYGYSGNSPSPDAGGPYNIIEPYYHWIMGSNSGYILKTPANRKLAWEKTRTWNIGLDFAFFDHRLSGSVDVYQKKTTDLLSYKSLNVLSGFSTVYANVGELENKGVELSLFSNNIATKDFRWNTSINLSYNKNEVVDFYIQPTTSAYTRLTRHYEQGYPSGALFALKWAGLSHNEGMAQAYDKDGNVVTDFNKLTAEDTYYVGTVIPKWNGSVMNQFYYKDFDLSALIIFNLGHKLRTDPYMQSGGRFLENRLMTFDKRWRNPGDEAITDVPSAYDDLNYSGRAALNGEFIYQYSDNLIQSASYFKLRELALGYSLPEKLCSKLYADNLRLRFAAHNLLCIAANDKGIDPEAFNLYSGKRATQYGAYYSIGLTVNF